MKHAQTKFGKLDLELNFFSKILFIVMVNLSLILIMMRGFEGTTGSNLILFFKYFLLLSSIIPISMRVNLDFAKLVYKFLIDRDKQMKTPLCRNSNIP
jgi:phospholipid-translocating ATPase